MENKSNYKALYQICNKLLFCDESNPLPPGQPQELVYDLTIFFINKIEKIMQVLQDSNSVDNNAPQDRQSFIENDYTTEHIFDFFDIVATETVTQILEMHQRNLVNWTISKPYCRKISSEHWPQGLHPL